jgi:hypothetical protein
MVDFTENPNACPLVGGEKINNISMGEEHTIPGDDNVWKE